MDNKKYDEVSSLIENKNINEAIALLRSMATQSPDLKIRDEIDRIADTYRYMVHYLLEGVDDPHRMEMYSELIESLKSVLDRIRRNNDARDSSDPYSETFRIIKMRAADFPKLLAEYASVWSELSLAHAAGNDTAELHKRLEFIQNDVFNCIWVSLGDKDLMKAAATAVSQDSLYGQDLGIIILNAMMLSLLCYYDRAKLLTLADIYDADISERISARALVAIVLSLDKYASRVVDDKAMQLRFDVWKDSIITYRRLREVIRAILRTRDTQRISNKMKDEVLPEIMKLKPDVLKNLRSGFDPENMGENNPEWEEMLEKSGLGKKMRELSDMQSDGADLMMVAFANLKQFPFFNNVANWFLPFDAEHSYLNADLRGLLEKMMLNADSVCDSDKYSLAIALATMPSAQRQMMVSQLEMQLAQVSEEMADSLKTSTPVFDTEITKSLRDLYRFVKLFRKKNDFPDPFEKAVNFLDIPFIGEILDDEEIVSLAAEFYFRNGYYTEALPLFSHLSEASPEDASLYEKIGFCYQSIRFYDRALIAYDKAALIHDPGEWLVKKLAYINKITGNYSAALSYYRQLLEKDPENVNLLLSAAYCALECEDAAQALQYYYHAGYLAPENLRIMRATGWAEMVNGNYAKSIKLYDKVIAIEPSPADFLNAGHAALLAGNYRQASEMYAKASSGNKVEFEKTFRNDLDNISRLGADRNIALIILDNLNLGA